jgi:hypothetical protein
MSMFSICTDFIPEGKLQESLAEYASAEKKFTAEIGVLFRRFFQCAAQPHIIWAITEWQSEKHHNDAAQSIMRKRRDDRFASILFGPNPYFEIFCKEEKELRIGNFDDSLNFVIVASGLINSKARDKFLALRKERTAEMQEKLTWLGTYHNIYNPDQFIAFLGFRDEEAFKQVRQVGDLLLEEYLFTGLRKPLGMSFLAGYNQFICTSFSLAD